MQTFTQQETDRHNALTHQGWSLIDGEILLNVPRPLGKPNWLVKRKLLKAVVCFEQALEINAEGWSSMWAVGKIHQRLGEPEQAFRWFERAHQTNPAQTDVAREAGLAALDLGKAEAALRLCGTAVELAPDDPGLIANLAWAHLISGHIALAQETIAKAVAADPDDDISKTVQRIMNEVASGVRPLPKNLLEISKFH